MSNKIKKKQIENQAQEGRSMVEMLGVLAIIGVLSIGGIAGYSWGMDKHITNQILYEMNLNSAQLAMLLQKGNPEGVTLSLGSPYDDKATFSTVNYGFDYGCGESEDDEVAPYQCRPAETGYFMEVTGLPKRICNMLNNSVLGMAYYYNHAINGSVEDAECNDTDNIVTVFFETDSTIDGEISRPAEPETPTPTPEVTEPTTTTTTTEATTPETTTTPESTNPECNLDTCPGNKCNNDGTCNCPTGTTWNNGECACADGKYLYGNQCVTCDTSTGGTWDSTSKRCKCDNGIWDMEEEKCVEASCGTGETTCNDNQYCDTSPTSSCSSGKNTKADQGTCKDIGNVQEKTINGKTYYYNNESYFDWWSAQRYCQALAAKGKGHGLMVSMEELGCPAGKTGSGACADGALLKALYSTCKKGQDCCTEGKLCCDKDSDCPSFSNYVWTSTTGGSNSCYVYDVTLNSGLVRYRFRNGGPYALCE